MSNGVLPTSASPDMKKTANASGNSAMYGTVACASTMSVNRIESATITTLRTPRMSGIS